MLSSELLGEDEEATELEEDWLLSRRLGEAAIEEQAVAIPKNYSTKDSCSKALGSVYAGAIATATASYVARHNRVPAIIPFPGALCPFPREIMIANISRAQ